MSSRGENQEERDRRVRDLTARVAAGSETAFTDLYRIVFDRLFRHVLLLTSGNEELCKDVVQATLMRIIRYIRPFDNERALWSWIRHIARSCHVDLLRKAGREPYRLTLEVVDQSAIEESDEDGDDPELLQALDKGLLDLQPAERQLIHLAYFEDVSHRDIAMKLETTPKAVESKLARTREKLRAFLLAVIKQYELL